MNSVEFVTKGLIKWRVFSPVDQAEISGRPHDEILLKYCVRLYDKSFSPGWNFSLVRANRAETRNISHVIVPAQARVVMHMRCACIVSPVRNCPCNQTNFQRAVNSPCNQPLRPKGVQVYSALLLFWNTISNLYVIYQLEGLHRYILWPIIKVLEMTGKKLL